MIFDIPVSDLGDGPDVPVEPDWPIDPDWPVTPDVPVEPDSPDDPDWPTVTVETIAGTNSINVLSGTYRYTSTTPQYTWQKASFYSDQNYFGQKFNEQKINDHNVALIPVGSFNFSGESTKLVVAIDCYRPSYDFSTFCWAVCSSDANKTMYQGAYGKVADNTQIVSGTASLSTLYWGTYMFGFPSSAFPPNTPLYIYFWPYASGKGVAHMKGTINASMYYYAVI